MHSPIVRGGGVLIGEALVAELLSEVLLLAIVPARIPCRYRRGWGGGGPRAERLEECLHFEDFVPYADLALDLRILAVCWDKLILFEEKGVLAGGFASWTGNLFTCLELADSRKHQG